MNYGYDDTTAGWDPRRSGDLAVALQALVATDPAFDPPATYRRPYVEVDGFYPGVRVRSLTRVADMDRAVKLLDATYDRVMHGAEPAVERFILADGETHDVVRNPAVPALADHGPGFDDDMRELPRGIEADDPDCWPR